ncbi:MAG TPA: methyltransferase domain-containing protein [Ignavibacteriaceae bacterium]|nr:methyltransferase domain-containing protein [Ignavibacteriaceae bacterium]
MMADTHNIFLPGGFKQSRILKSKYMIADKSILVIGSGSEKIALKMAEAGAAFISLIVNDYESLISSRFVLPNQNKVSAKLMDYDNTDFNDNEFDLVYAQASISTKNRNKIIKEIKRILKPGGTFCTGEITAFTKKYPPFVRDIFESSDVSPLLHDSCENYFIERKFEIIYSEDLSSSLKNFYETVKQSLKDVINELSEKEKSYYKKLLNKISHESNAYLKLGADRYIGFKMLILKKSE